MLASRLCTFLETNHTPYAIQTHSLAFTAQGIAALTHTPGREMVKTVIVRAGGRYVMAVLPASEHIEFEALAHAIGASEAQIADEHEFGGLFPDCEVGAMPPFGNLYGLPVFMDEDLTTNREIAFNAGSHREIMRVPLGDYLKLVRPTIVAFARHALVH